MREKEGDSKIYRLMLPSYFLPKVVIGENNFISLANQNAQRATDDRNIELSVQSGKMIAIHIW